MAGIPPDDPAEFEEAVRFFRQRVPMPDWKWDALTEEERTFAFKVSGAAQADLATQAWEAMDKAIAQGTTLEEFKRDVGAKLEAAWGRTDPHRLETIFRTNALGAYNAGRHEILSHPEVRKARPYLRFDAVNDSRVSDVCEALDGTIRPADDPFWTTHTPPLHFNCRSVLVPLSDEEAQDEGVSGNVVGAEADEGFGRPPPAGGGADWEPDPKDYPGPIGEVLDGKLQGAPAVNDVAPPEPEPDHGPDFPALEPAPAPDLEIPRVPFATVKGDQHVFIAKNNDALTSLAKDVERLVQAPGAAGTREHVAQDIKAGGLYHIGDRRVVLNSGVAARLQALLARGTAEYATELGDLEVLAHEHLHGASHPGYSRFYERNSDGPVAALEEGTTELLGQHYLRAYSDGVGIKLGRRAEEELGQLFYVDPPNRVTGHKGGIRARSSTYADFVNGFAKAVELVDDLDAAAMEGPALDRHIAGRALQIKRLDGSAGNDERYGALVRPLLDRHGISAKHPRAAEIRENLRKAIGDFVQAKGGFTDQEVGTLRSAVRRIIEGS